MKSFVELFLLLWVTKASSATDSTSVPYTYTISYTLQNHQTPEFEDAQSGFRQKRSAPTVPDRCTWPRSNRLRPDLIQLGVILPLASHHQWSLKMAVPAISIAVEDVKSETDLLRGYTVQINVRDSKCSETIGPLAAIDMYVNQSADVFLGPACDYSVAPVARFSKYWGIPVLSGGALVSAFRDKTEYRLLTRVQATYAKVGQFLLHMFTSFSWSHAAILYDDVPRSPNAEKRRCYFIAEGIYQPLLGHFGREPYNERFDERKSDVDYETLLREASAKARGIRFNALRDRSTKRTKPIAEEIQNG
ncbi:guanylate cyclase [Elysia marginata]|uniref:Guanylate cyclase n=1 Tax=Elysia marginata TaxID=1093978 RepID=A0AAV4H7S3_9GAST|nr:guanylate cyclase [Elysia marginata]